MQCPNCTHWNESGARFCEECGFELVESDSKPVPQAVPAVMSVDEVPDPEPQTLIPAAAPQVSLNGGAYLIMNATGTIFKLGDVVVIGREDASLQIDLDGYTNAQFISHRHAQITKKDEQYYVEDLGSANATRVNERKLAPGQAEPLHDGDHVRLGKIELTFHSG